MRGMRILILFISILVFACQTDTEKGRSTELDELRDLLAEQPELVENPQTPAEVFQNWQIHMDRNQFDEAAKWSTAETREWIAFIRTMVEAAGEAENTVTTSIEEIQCRESGDTSTCLYAQAAGDSLRLDSVRLVRQDGIWMVDLYRENERDNQ